MMMDDPAANGAAADAADLARLQRWMQMVITDARGVGNGLAAAGAVLHPAHLEDVVTPSATLTSAQRLAIYSRSYHARLVSCFAAIFPCLRHALGEALFSHFTIDYLQHHPPTSYTLDRLADAFPAHLERTRPDAGRAVEERERWPDFIIELATLEHALLRVHEGPGIEVPGIGGMIMHGDATMTAMRIDALPPRRFGEIVLLRAPSLRLFRFGYRVHDYFRAWRREEHPALPAPQPCVVAVSRRNYRVKLDDVSAHHAALLNRIDGRAALAEVAAQAGVVGDVTLLRDTVRGWIEGGWVTVQEG